MLTSLTVVPPSLPEFWLFWLTFWVALALLGVITWARVDLFIGTDWLELSTVFLLNTFDKPNSFRQRI